MMSDGGHNCGNKPYTVVNVCILLLRLELKDDILAREATIDRRERVELVLQQCGFLRIKEPAFEDGN